ncbi:(2Fe-2S)-binding protein [Yunchengibacter salinarum]|uniref:(2Fe-2S)-binding protein n=1 Tax=Yunchengibacter salinarum TaxID=3133399 RepID=UPI0035B68D0E
MYVCLCNGYTDRDIRESARQTGAQDADTAYMALGGGFCCGSCRDCAEDLVESERTAPLMLAAE